jgi:hypothetical protein
VLRLGERLDDSGGRINAQVVEDRDVEDQKRQQSAGEAEQQPLGTPERLVHMQVGGYWHELNIT